MKTLIFKISLFGDDEDVCWREVEITTNKSLSRLAEGIVTAFEFDFDHAYGFYSNLDDDYYSSQTKYELFADMDDDMMLGSQPALSVEKTKSGKVFHELGQKMQFIFDYGDEWRFLIELTGFGEKVARRRYPCLTNAKGDAPVQYPDWDEGEDREEETFIDANPQTAEIIPFGKDKKTFSYPHFNSNLTDILEDLANCNDRLPVETLQYCLANRGAIVPRFLEILNRHAAAQPLDPIEEDALFFIIHVLSDFKERQAFQPLCRILKRGNEDEIGNLFGEDLITLPQVLLSVYDGDKQTLYKFIEDATFDEFLRNIAFDVWGYLVADGRIDREEARQYLIDAFNALSPKTQNMVWGGWLLNVSNLGFAELTDKAAILIQDGRMPERWTSEAYFRKDMSESVRDKNPVARYEEMGIKPFSDIVEQLSEWASFKQESVASPRRGQPDNIVTNIFRQIGRNDPCPCGSGKKYKKCCLH